MLPVHYESIEEGICGGIVGLAMPAADSVGRAEEKEEIKWLLFKCVVEVPRSENFGGYGNCPVFMRHL